LTDRNTNTKLNTKVSQRTWKDFK